MSAPRTGHRMHALAEANAWIARVPNLWTIAVLAVVSWVAVAGAGALVLSALGLILG